MAEWFKRCFIPQAMERNTSGKTILLIYDGHQSHETIELRATALGHQIELYCLPPHTSHRLQPLDVGVFGPLQRAWQNRCVIAREEGGEGIARSQVVRHYMAARSESFKESTILAAWRNSGISPLDPGIFTSKDFAPSRATSIKSPLPASFPTMPGHRDLGDELEEDTNDIHDWISENEDDGEVTSELDVGEAEEDPRPVLNQGISSDHPLLAETTTNTTQAQPESLPPPLNLPSHQPTQDPLLDVQAPSEPSDHPGEQDHNPFPMALSHNRTPHCQTRLMTRTASCQFPQPSQPCESSCSELKSEVRILRIEVDNLKTQCFLASQAVTRLHVKLNTKENKKGARAQAKKVTVEARVLTSEEGRLEMQQLQEELRLKELHRNEERARKAAEEQARRKRRADISLIFTGSLNKSRRKEELEDIAVALALPEVGTKDDLFKRIVEEFEANPEQKTNPRFVGLFNSRPRKRARVDNAPIVDSC